MEFPLKLIVHSATPKRISRSANPDQLRTDRSASNLHPCGRFWPKSSKFSSLKEMTKVPSLSLFGSGQLFDLTAPDLCVPGIPEGVLQQVISSEHGQCVMAASSPHRFFAALRVEAPFSAVSLFPMGSTSCVLFDSLHDLVGRNTLLQGGSSG